MGTTRRVFLKGALGTVALAAGGVRAAGAAGQPAGRLLGTPAGYGPADIITSPGRVSVGPGATLVLDDTDGKEAVHSRTTLDAQVVDPIRPHTTAFVFLANDGTAAYVYATKDDRPSLTRVGRAWRGGDDTWVTCRGRRGPDGVGGVQVVYDIGGDPTPRMWIEGGTCAVSGCWNSTTSAMNGYDDVEYDAVATVSGGGSAGLRSKAFELPSLPTGRHPVKLILGNIGDVLEYTTDVGTTIDLQVTKGTETV